MTEILKPRIIESAIDSDGNTVLPLPFHGSWLRYREPIIWNLPLTEIVAGQRNTGKSALCENLSTHYVGLNDNNKILDMFGACDNEGLSWLRSPYSEQCLLVCADNCDLSSSWDWLHIKDLNFQTMTKYKVIISVSAFYKEIKDEHFMVKQMMDMLWQRTHWKGNMYCLLMREMANLIYSRTSIGESEHEAKAYFLYALRMARHMGLAVVGDTVRYMSIDIDLRSLADRLYIKAMGKDALPDNLKFMYRYVDLKSIMRMPQKRFALITRMGSIGRGAFAEPPWHKHEHEDMLEMFSIKRDFGEGIDYGDKGWQPVSDFMHNEMIQLSVNKFLQDEKGNMIHASCRSIATKIARSPKTVCNNLNEHNDSIEQYGFCERCKRINSSLATILSPMKKHKQGDSE